MSTVDVRLVDVMVAALSLVCLVAWNLILQAQLRRWRGLVDEQQATIQKCTNALEVATRTIELFTEACHSLKKNDRLDS